MHTCSYTQFPLTPPPLPYPSPHKSILICPPYNKQFSNIKICLFSISDYGVCLCLSQFRRPRAITRSKIGPRLSHVVLTNSIRIRTARPPSRAMELARIHIRLVQQPTPARPNARPRRHLAVTPTTHHAHRPPEPDQEATATARPPRDPTDTVTTRIAFRYHQTA